MLVREVVDQGLRPDFPAAFPAGVRDLAALCWSATPARRPSAPEVDKLYAEACKARGGRPGSSCCLPSLAAGVLLFKRTCL